MFVFSNGKRSLVGDLFGLLSAMSYGLFTGLPEYLVLIHSLLSILKANCDILFHFSIMLQFCLRSLQARKEKGLMFKNCLDTSDSLHL